MKKFDLVRSLLYVPTYNEKYMLSAFQSEADVLILDLEDSVPFSQKVMARENLLKIANEATRFNGHIIVRLNSLADPEQVIEDLKYINIDSVNGFMLPKVNNAEDLLTYEHLIKQQFGENELYFIPLIETSLVILYLKEIAEFKRVKGLAFGGEDYITDLHGKHGKSTAIFEFARVQIVNAARAFGKKTIDTPFLALDDHAGFMAATENASELGFDGMQCIHPSQLQRLNQLLTPDEVEYEHSIKIVSKIDEAKQSGKGVIIFNGKMIGPPMVKRAQNIINSYELIQAKKNFFTGGLGN